MMKRRSGFGDVGAPKPGVASGRKSVGRWRHAAEAECASETCGGGGGGRRGLPLSKDDDGLPSAVARLRRVERLGDSVASKRQQQRHVGRARGRQRPLQRRRGVGGSGRVGAKRGDDVDHAARQRRRRRRRGGGAARRKHRGRHCGGGGRLGRGCGNGGGGGGGGGGIVVVVAIVIVVIVAAVAIVGAVEAQVAAAMQVVDPARDGAVGGVHGRLAALEHHIDVVQVYVGGLEGAAAAAHEHLRAQPLGAEVADGRVRHAHRAEPGAGAAAAHDARRACDRGVGAAGAHQLERAWAPQHVLAAVLDAAHLQRLRRVGRVGVELEHGHAHRRSRGVGAAHHDVAKGDGAVEGVRDGKGAAERLRVQVQVERARPRREGEGRHAAAVAPRGVGGACLPRDDGRELYEPVGARGVAQREHPAAPRGAERLRQRHVGRQVERDDVGVRGDVQVEVESERRVDEADVGAAADDDRVGRDAGAQARRQQVSHRRRREEHAVRALHPVPERRPPTVVDEDLGPVAELV